ncbi:MAG: META domain-containing protein [Dehalococcoidales bacterium]
MKKEWLLIAGLVLVLGIVGLTGCQADIADSEEPPVSHGGLTTDYISLIDNLRQAGATVEPAGELTQPFFSVSGRVIVVSGGDVQVFEYADGAAAEAEATLVSTDGSSIGTTMVSWVAPPHFYQAGRLIVLYVGDGTDVINVLEAVLGQQFAGSSGGLENIRWILESYGKQGDLQAVLEGTEVTVLFDSAEGQIGGSGGCNSYSGEYTLNNNELSIHAMTWTEIGCPEPQGILEQETQYLKTLQSAESYEIRDGKLRITVGSQLLIFRSGLLFQG